MSIFDIIIASVILLSTLLGAYKGAIKICLGWLSLLGALLIAYLIFPYFKEILNKHIQNHRILDVVASISSYLLSLIILSFLSGKLESLFQVVSAGPIDRFFGLIIGLIRGYIIGLVVVISVGIFSLKETAVLGNNINKIRDYKTYPKWLTQSLSFDYFDIGLVKILALLPKDILKSFNLFNETKSQKLIDILKHTIPKEDSAKQSDDFDLEQEKLEKDNNLSLDLDELF